MLALGALRWTTTRSFTAMSSRVAWLAPFPAFENLVLAPVRTTKLHGAVVPEGQALPATHYTMTAAPDGNIYYTATYNRGAALYLLRLRTSTGTPEVVGQVGPLPPRPPGYPHRSTDRLMVQGSTAGPDGTLYIMLAYPLRVLVFPRLVRP